MTIYNVMGRLGGVDSMGQMLVDMVGMGWLYTWWFMRWEPRHVRGGFTRKQRTALPQDHFHLHCDNGLREARSIHTTFHICKALPLDARALRSGFEFDGIGFRIGRHKAAARRIHVPQRKHVIKEQLEQQLKTQFLPVGSGIRQFNHLDMVDCGSQRGQHIDQIFQELIEIPTRWKLQSNYGLESISRNHPLPLHPVRRVSGATSGGIAGIESVPTALAHHSRPRTPTRGERTFSERQSPAIGTPC